MGRKQIEGTVVTEARPPGDRRAQMIAAAIDSLKDVGYAGTSIREIARRGGFNSALISYYFGGLHGLLLAALDHSSTQRMQRYTAAVESAGSLTELLDVARGIYREDVEGGHITIFTEMVAASLAHSELRPELVDRSGPWLDFVEGAIEKAAADTPLLQVLPAREIAYAILCFYLGVNLMTQLEPDDARLERLFDVVSGVAPVVTSLLGGPALGEAPVPLEH
jgi:AcrR family transcriptional regulator